MYTYKPVNDDGSVFKKRSFSKVDRETNNIFIAVSASWIKMVSNHLDLLPEEVPYSNIALIVRRAWERSKYTHEDFKNLFDYFLNDPRLRTEDKISYDLCLSEKYMAKFKLSQRASKNSQVSVAGEIRL